MSEAAKERLEEARAALARGDTQQAIVELSAAIELEPSIDALLIRAEAVFSTGNVDEALSDVDKAEGLYDADPKSSSILWERIDDARNRYNLAKNPDPGPPIKQTISVLLPIQLSDPADIFIRVNKRRELQSDGKTLLRKHGTVIYDMEILDRNPVWADSIIELTRGTRANFHADFVRNHTQFFHLQAPNKEFVQQTRNQYEVASQLLHTLDPLMRAVNAPIALFRNSNQVNACEEIFNCAAEETPANVCAAFCKIYNDEENACLFSVGMHALGYADAQIPYELLPVEVAHDVLYEFHEFQCLALTWNIGDSMQFSSKISNQTYLLNLYHCGRFETPGEARFNQFGLWIFEGPA
ncbi:MAG: hypothetical protein DKT66_25195 [Candidatus Melainabacteria bacterium]|nr:MAG: hypothetical protein DKT66_25195 [Candidatus Melainabacteria bacterium]